jgi:hypothetical protein
MSTGFCYLPKYDWARVSGYMDRAASGEAVKPVHAHDENVFNALNIASRRFPHQSTFKNESLIYFFLVHFP